MDNTLIVVVVLIFIILLRNYQRETFYYNPFYRDFYQTPMGALQGGPQLMNNLAGDIVFPPAYSNMFTSDINDRMNVFGQVDNGPKNQYNIADGYPNAPQNMV